MGTYGLRNVERQQWEHDAPHRMSTAFSYSVKRPRCMFVVCPLYVQSRWSAGGHMREPLVIV